MNNDIFSLHYDELLNCAKNHVRLKRLLSDPDELVNDAFILFYESGLPFDIRVVKGYIVNSSFSELTHQLSVSKFNDNFLGKAHANNITDLTCKKCGHTKPVNAFKQYRHLAEMYTSNTCNECDIKDSIRWKKENKERWNSYMRERRSLTKKIKVKKTIHEQWNEANRRYIKKQKDNLTDVYIRSVLGRNIDKSPENIEKKRQELLNKRMVEVE